MSAEQNPDSPQITPAAASGVPSESPSAPHANPAQAFWQLLTHYDATKVSPHRALRNAIGVALPLVGGFLLQMPRGGLVMASGALNVSYSDGGDPYAARAKRMLASSILCAIAVFAGAISGKHQVIAVMLASGWAFVAGLVVALDGAAADLGVISLVTLLIYAAQPLTPHQAAISGLLALAGGFLQTLLSVALWPVRRYDPERRVLANFYQELAERSRAPLDAMSAPMATVHSEQARETLLGLGRDSSDESVRYRSLLNQGERIRLSLLRLSRLRVRMEREKQDNGGVEILRRYMEWASSVLRDISSALQHSGKDPQPSDSDIPEQLEEQIAKLRAQERGVSGSFLGAVTKDTIFQMEALSGQLRAALDIAHQNTALDNTKAVQSPTRPTWQKVAASWADTLQANLNLQSPAFRHALRLAGLVALGDFAGRVVSWRRTYWMPMTIVLVLKPEFTATFSRGLLRIAGTIVGLLLATGLFHLFPPSTAMEVILIFAFVYLLRWVGPANYGIFGILVSALIVLLLAVNGVAPKDVIWARGINTVAGGILTLVVYWLWPTWERSRVSARIAQLLDAYRVYVHVIVRFNPKEPSGLSQLDQVRRAARIARSNLMASADRLGAEPGSTPALMSQLSAVLASSHRLVHAFMSLDAILLEDSALSSSPPVQTFADSVEKTLSLLAAALRAAHVHAKDFPDLREQYRVMVQARGFDSDAHTLRFDPINIEADRVTNSLNTLAEQIRTWTRTPQFIALHKMQLSSQTPRV